MRCWRDPRYGIRKESEYGPNNGTRINADSADGKRIYPRQQRKAVLDVSKETFRILQEVFDHWSSAQHSSRSRAEVVDINPNRLSARQTGGVSACFLFGRQLNYPHPSLVS